MKKVNRIHMIVLILIAPFILLAQGEVEKIVKVKIVKTVAGNTTVTDTVITTFGSTEDDIEFIIEESMGLDSLSNATFEKIEIVGENISGRRGEHKVMVFTDENGNREVFVNHPKQKRAAHRWRGIDRNEQEFGFRVEHLDSLHENLNRHRRDATRRFERLEYDFEVSADTDNINWECLPPPPPRKPNRPKHGHFKGGTDEPSSVSQQELRKAGIKDQPDKLSLQLLDINNQNGLVILRFMPKNNVGKVRVDVYNFFGDRVFSEKVELVGDVYQATIDLSAKQPGVYYIQLIRKKESATQRIRL